MKVFEELEKINSRPEPFEFYTAEELWTEEYTSKQMLSYHLNGEIDVSSRNTMFIDQSVEWISSYFNIGKESKIIDFGCGPGLYTQRLAQKQANVTGVDFSKRSIQYAQDFAKSKGLSINYINKNYLDFECNDSFQLIIMIMCDFCALSPNQRKQMLNKFHQILDSGGCVLLDVYSLTGYEQREETAIYEYNYLNKFWSQDDYYCFLNTFKYDENKVILDKHTIIEKCRIRTIFNWLQYFTPETLKKEFEECGFIIENIFSDVAGSSYNPKTTEFAIVAKKK